jgi:hypothetical protein
LRGSSTSSQRGKRKISDTEDGADNAQEGAPAKKSRTSPAKVDDKKFVFLFSPERKWSTKAQVEILKVAGIKMFKKVDIADCIWAGLAYVDLLLQALPGGCPGECLGTPMEGHCPYPSCKQKLDGSVAHYRRHVATHYGDVGYYTICPLCGHATKRVDNHDRHFEACDYLRNGNGVQEKASPDLVQKMKKNIFLR